MNIAVFVSGNGSNLQAIIDAVGAGLIKARISVVVCDAKDAFALERAKKAGIETLFIDPSIYGSRKEYYDVITKYMEDYDIGLICLAGYMRLLNRNFVKRYENRIINIHPALLPSFKGLNGVRDALEYGVKVTGPTVHFVTKEVDSGPIISQAAVKVEESDTEESLREKVHRLEHKIYPEAIRDFVEGKLSIEGRKVKKEE